MDSDLVAAHTRRLRKRRSMCWKGMDLSQEGPFSPFLSNLMLDDLDKELEQRTQKGKKFLSKYLGDKFRTKIELSF